MKDVLPEDRFKIIPFHGADSHIDYGLVVDWAITLLENKMDMEETVYLGLVL